MPEKLATTSARSVNSGGVIIPQRTSMFRSENKQNDKGRAPGRFSTTPYVIHILIAIDALGPLA